MRYHITEGREEKKAGDVPQPGRQPPDLPATPSDSKLSAHGTGLPAIKLMMEVTAGQGDREATSQHEPCRTQIKV